MATVPQGPRETTVTLGAPSAGPFSVGFRLFDDDALDVFVNGARSTDWTLSATYTDGYTDAASITFGSSLDTADVLVIQSNLTPGRDADYIPGDPTLVSKMNVELARLWSSVADLHRGVARSLRGFASIDPAAGVDLDLIVQAEAFAERAEDAQAEAEAAAALAQSAQENLFDAWRGAWLTATAYEQGDLVREAGSTYICLADHTSDVFATDLSADRWALFAQQGSGGAGTGDMVAANNLSDVANVATARANLGLGGLATLSNITTAQVAAATLVTESEGIASNDNDTTLPTSAAVKDYVDSNAPGGWSWLAPQSTVSGADKEFTGIPAWATEICIVFKGCSLSSGGNLRVELGSAGGFETSGYSQIASIPSLSGSVGTNGFPVILAAASAAATGEMTLKHLGSNEWSSSHAIAATATRTSIGGGTKTLSGTLTQVRVVKTEGNWDAGEISVGYR